MVFAWMAERAREYAKYRESGPVDTLNGQPTCQFGSKIKPIESVADLKERFVYALLADDGAGYEAREAWRSERRIGINQCRIIHFRHLEPFEGGAGFRCEADIKEAVDWLLVDSLDKRLKTSPNEYHDDAVVCHGCQVEICSEGRFEIVMKYGPKRDQGWSQWRYSLALAEVGEPFVPVLRRAVDTFSAMVR